MTHSAYDLVSEEEDGGCLPVLLPSAALGTSLGDAELGSGTDDKSVQIPTSWDLKSPRYLLPCHGQETAMSLATGSWIVAPFSGCILCCPFHPELLNQVVGLLTAA